MFEYSDLCQWPKNGLKVNSSNLNENYLDEIIEKEKKQEPVFSEKRHLEEISGLAKNPPQIWTPKDRMRTVSVAVVLCLNVGIDPPDIVKPSPCAVLQAWTDPFTVGQNSQKSVEVIATALTKQYERWHPKARFKTCTDPTVEDLKKACCALRKAAKEERVLLHYNGHGVPKPTANGEIWVFNRTFTQYIPLSLYELQQWMGSPSIYVFDCSNAGIIIEFFKKFASEHQKEFEINQQLNNYLIKEGEEGPPKAIQPRFENCLLLAACDKDETIPLHPDLPADLFSSCLTTPIRTFLVWFIKQNPHKLSPDVGISIIDKIPGSVTDRKSVMGELNWIFTAITDTIAWNSLPHELFQRLFRHDLLVASLFRNFLLAQRIMRSYDCTPVSNPPMKGMHHHPMWNCWDMAVDHCLSQLAQMGISTENGSPQTNATYINSQFFTEQLTAFQLWLKLNPKPNSTPEQLPILLQVLLSQVHRSRALDLLGQFLNLGSWAVDLALSVGIYPYMLKLLQSSARELKPFLVFIWTKILAGHYTIYQNEIFRENRYFLNVLSDTNMSVNHQVMSAFIIATMVRHNVEGQNAVVQSGANNPAGSLIDIATGLLEENQVKCQIKYASLRKWLLICLGNVWENNEENRWMATRNAVPEKLSDFLEDPVPEVRAAAVFALGTFINSAIQRNDHANEVDRRIVSTIVQKLYYDNSPLVRKEVLVSLQWYVLIFENVFVAMLRKKLLEETQARSGSKELSPAGSPSSNVSFLTNRVTLGDGLSDLNKMQINGSPTSHSRKLSSLFNLNNSFNSSKMFLHPSSNSTIVPQNTPPEGNFIGMHRVNSNNSLSKYSGCTSISSINLASHSLTNIYSRIWQLIELHTLDPSQDVRKLAVIISNELQTKFRGSRTNACSESGVLDLSSQISISKPSVLSLNNQNHHSGRASVSAVSSPYIPNAYAGFQPRRMLFSKDPAADDDQRNGIKLTINKGSLAATETIHVCRKPLVTTRFVDWCIKQFSEPCPNDGIYPNLDLPADDLNVDWKTKLISQYKAKSDIELKSSSTKELKVLKQVRNVRSRRLIFHPFEKCMVVCDRYTFSLWNYSEDNTRKWSNGNDECAKITDMKLLNTQNQATLMVASNDGSVKVWRDVFPTTFSELSPEENEYVFEPKLSTAFFIFEDMADQPRSADRNNLLLLSWIQTDKTLVAGGDSRVIRLWDAEQERKIRDIPIESEMITSLSTDISHIVCAGCSEGTVKLYDYRSSNTPSQSIHNPSSPIVSAKISSTKDVKYLVCGNKNGNIRWYDRRNTTKHIRMESLGSTMTSMTFHEQTDVFACAYGNDSISQIQLFTMNTLKGPTIKLRNRKIKHLLFHPFKTKLGLVTSDSSITIFKCPLREEAKLTL